MKIHIPTILIIFGISGDLSKRKLLPAIGQMAEKGELPTEFFILGITRHHTSLLSDYVNHISNNKEYLSSHSELFVMDLNLLSEYKRLMEYIKVIEKNFSTSPQILFYLSVPPHTAESIIEFLGISRQAEIEGVKLIMEKPSGLYLESAKKLITHINQYFKPEQIYRVDHYLAKETAQNIIPFRRNNPTIENTLNKNFVNRIVITASEAIGIEGRILFYEQTGALRDLVQSHLLELSALILMNINDSTSITIAESRAKALSHLHVSPSYPVIRGQYEGYKKEVANENSATETFVALTLQSSDPRWISVPIQIITGKSLKEKYTKIQIFFKEEGREQLEFIFKDKKAEAHEYIFSHVISSKPDLFVSSQEVLETWRIIEPIQQKWKESPSEDLIIYEKGSTVEEILKNYIE